jgi:hypothetical protein
VVTTRPHLRRDRRRRDAVLVASVIALLLGGAAEAAESPPVVGEASPPQSMPSATGRAETPPTTDLATYQPLCAEPERGSVACTSLIRTDQPAVAALGQGAQPAGLSPRDLQSAYELPSTTAGVGMRVAVVVAYDNPSAETDLAVYRRQFGLPPCTGENGCFQKVNQTGDTLLPRADKAWAQEGAVGLAMVSAVCPQCSIMLVEAGSTYTFDLGAAVRTAVAMGARFIVNGYGAPETSFQRNLDTQYFNHPGVVLTAGAGNTGQGLQYPASSPGVVAVGGTSLTKASTARGWAEAAWGNAVKKFGAGSGCSAYSAKPAWQRDTQCVRRTVADVAAVADPQTGVAVYSTFDGEGGWRVYGGTSVSASIIAGVFALAGTPTPDTNPASYLYANAAALRDVTTGSVGDCTPRYLCSARSGYDGPTGLGTPAGVAAFRLEQTGEPSAPVPSVSPSPLRSPSPPVSHPSSGGRYDSRIA